MANRMNTFNIHASCDNAIHKGLGVLLVLLRRANCTKPEGFVQNALGRFFEIRIMQFADY